MKVLILTGPSPNRMAGIVAEDLLCSLNSDKEFEAKLIVHEYGNYKKKDIISIYRKLEDISIRVIRRIKVYFERRKLKKEEIKIDLDYFFLEYDQSIQYISTDRLLKKIKSKPDAIIVLFMTHFLNYQNLFELNQKTNAPIFLYLMDMVGFTGGCHYAWDCKGYFKECGYCPALFSTDPKDQSFLNYKFKQFYISKTDLEVVICSEELNNQTRNASLLSDKKLHSGFFLPINEEIYKPTNKADIRKELNLPLEEKIIFFGAGSVMSKRKGFKELITALKILYNNLSEKQREFIHLLIAGHVQEEISNSISFKYTTLGFQNHTTLPKLFQASDIFASPSIEDSGPMMVNQSLMCGIPVVAFDVGVAKDLIKNGITGYKAKSFDCNDFARGISKLIQLNELQAEEISKNCRETALNKYSYKATSERWRNFLKSKMLSKK